MCSNLLIFCSNKWCLISMGCFTGCSFGGRFYSLEETWHPDLGEPFGVMHCVQCHCEPVSLVGLWFHSLLSQIVHYLMKRTFNLLVYLLVCSKRVAGRCRVKWTAETSNRTVPPWTVTTLFCFPDTAVEPVRKVLMLCLKLSLDCSKCIYLLADRVLQSFLLSCSPFFILQPQIFVYFIGILDNKQTPSCRRKTIPVFFVISSRNLKKCCVFVMFTNTQVYSMIFGFNRSEKCFYVTVICFCVKCFILAMVACLWSLSSWKMKLCHSLKHFAASSFHRPFGLSLI